MRLSPNDTGIDLRDSVYGSYYINQDGDIIRLFTVGSEGVSSEHTVLIDHGNGSSVLLDRMDDDNAVNRIAAIGNGLQLFDEQRQGIGLGQKSLFQKLDLIP